MSNLTTLRTHQLEFRRVAGHAPRWSLAEALAASIACFVTGSLLLVGTGLIVFQPLFICLLHVVSISSLLLFLFLSKLGNRSTVTSLGSMVIILAAAFRSLNILDTLVYGTRIAAIPPTVPLPSRLDTLLIQAEALSVFGTIVFVSCWRIVVADRILELNLSLDRIQKLPRYFFWLAYIIAISIELLGKSSPDLLKLLAATRLTGSVYMLGAISIFFIVTTRRFSLSAAVFAFLLALPLSIPQLSSGMKSQIVFPLLPTGVILWSLIKGPGYRVLFICLGILGMAILTNFVEHVRKETWWQTRVTDTATLVQGFIEDLPKQSLFEGLNKFSARINLTCFRMITTAIANESGFEPERIIAPIPYTFIPRFLWPNKPVLEPGGQQYNRIYNRRLPDNKAAGAIASGFFNELYLGYGWTAWLIGAVLYGLGLGILQRSILYLDRGFTTVCLTFFGLVEALRIEEHHVVYAYTTIVLLFVALSCTAFANRAFFKSQI